MKMFTVKVGIENRKNYHSIDLMEWHPANSIQDAFTFVKNFEKTECFENWHFFGGEVKNSEGKIVGVINPQLNCMNGFQEEENEYYEKLPTTDVLILFNN
jgi:hypothetical protein